MSNEVADAVGLEQTRHLEYTLGMLLNTARWNEKPRLAAFLDKATKHWDTAGEAKSGRLREMRQSSSQF